MMQRALMALLWSLSCLSGAVAGGGEPGQKEKLEGYLEWRQGATLIVEGQRVLVPAEAKFKGKDDAKSLATTPLGYEMKVEGYRQQDGSLLATKLEAKANGTAMFEREVRQATDQLEAAYRQSGHFLQAANGQVVSLGELYQSGPRVERVRAIVDRLLPPYLGPEDVRVYVIDNEEWNAFAMGNYSIYVFRGLMDEVDDDELAIVLGHELAHATHEHTRRQRKKNMWIQMVGAGAAIALKEVDSNDTQAVASAIAGLSLTAWGSGYGRDQEDQADRVGMRYAYEGGFDVSKGPRLWGRFAEKYGDQDAVSNFFFGSHSRSEDRAKNLERELRFNYGSGRKAGEPR